MDVEVSEKQDEPTKVSEEELKMNPTYANIRGLTLNLLVFGYDASRILIHVNILYFHNEGF